MPVCKGFIDWRPLYTLAPLGTQVYRVYISAHNLSRTTVYNNLTYFNYAKVLSLYTTLKSHEWRGRAPARMGHLVCVGFRTNSGVRKPWQRLPHRRINHV